MIAYIGGELLAPVVKWLIVTCGGAGLIAGLVALGRKWIRSGGEDKAQLRIKDELEEERADAAEEYRATRDEFSALWDRLRARRRRRDAQAGRRLSH